VALLVEALRNPDYSGVYNGTAPNPVRMSELCSSLGAVLYAQYSLHIPALSQLRHGCCYCGALLPGCCIVLALRQRQQQQPQSGLEVALCSTADGASHPAADHGSWLTAVHCCKGVAGAAQLAAGARLSTLSDGRLSDAGGVLGRPSWLPVPDFALQTLLGEGAGVVLEGQRVLPARAQVGTIRSVTCPSAITRSTCIALCVHLCAFAY
jgi:Domain of unknown function (DUF1731)